MNSAEFDSVAASYEAQHRASIRFSGEETGFFAQYKAQDARALARAAGMEPARILDFGSGVGNSVAPLCEAFPQSRLVCLDVSEASLAHSRQRNGPRPEYRAYDGEVLPHDLGHFDLIFIACVFHHIPETLHVDMLRQIRGSLTRGGMVVLFEHNPLNPLTRHAVASCPFDENAVLIRSGEMRARFVQAGFAAPRVDYRLFFPKVLSRLRPLEPFLSWLPLGAQYRVTARA